MTITFADDTKRNLHFYGDFYRDSQSVREVMDALSATGKISYKIKGREIVIYWKNMDFTLPCPTVWIVLKADNLLPDHQTFKTYDRNKSC